MASLFHNCKKLSDISALKNWDTSNVTDMHNMFYYCDLKDISPITDWDTKNVREMG